MRLRRAPKVCYEGGQAYNVLLCGLRRMMMRWTVPPSAVGHAEGRLPYWRESQVM